MLMYYHCLIGSITLVFLKKKIHLYSHDAATPLKDHILEYTPAAPVDLQVNTVKSISELDKMLRNELDAACTQENDTETTSTNDWITLDSVGTISFN